MDERCIPQDWKMAHVSPIFKKEARNKVENYRPRSLTSTGCKLMESFDKDSIMTHMRAENLLSSKQYGFIDGRSTATQLLSYLDKCIDTIVSGGVADTIYFDFAKAFDSVPHERLLRKLKSYVSMVICSKVILFVIYTNDLPEVVKCGTYLFADDTKIFRQITTKEDAL